jgi:plasmid stabilization system protein ParE
VNGGASPNDSLRIGGGTTSTGLPDDLLSDASWRLFLACLVYAAAFSLAYGLPQMLADAGGVGESHSVIGNVAAAISIGAAVVFAIILRRPRLNPGLILTLGLVFEIVSCFGIAMSEWWEYFSPESMQNFHAPRSGLSWCYVWLLCMSGMIPATLGKKILASALAAAMPCVVLLSSFLYFRPDAANDILGTALAGSAITGAIIVGMAVVMSRVIYGLGRKIREARRVGSYHLTELIGAGGMGEVWRGDHRLLARPAAVKLVRRSAMESLGAPGTDRAMRRFEREAQETAQLRCPHTINVYDFGTASNGTFYYVMELLEGVNFETLVERFGPLPAERVGYLLRQACASLEEAHHRGLVHRDIKPSNLFCCRYGLRVDFVKVLDFGLVKPVRKQGHEATQLTAEGTLAGTPAYMAPESLLNEGEVDAMVDIYALGCVAYWLLTGQLVFEASSPMRMAIKHVEQPAVPPSARTELPVPEWLDQLVMDCLAKDPAQRPQSARALIERLDANPMATPWDDARAQAWWSKRLPAEGDATAP